MSAKSRSIATSRRRRIRPSRNWVERGGFPDASPYSTPKVHIGFRLAPDVVEGIKATGKGYNACVEAALREALKNRRLKGQGEGVRVSSSPGRMQADR